MGKKEYLDIYNQLKAELIYPSWVLIHLVISESCNRDSMTDDTTFRIYIGFSLQPPPLFFLSASPALRDKTPLHLLSSGYVSRSPPPPLPSLPSLLHLSQTDPTSSQEVKAFGAQERGCIPTLSSHRATHTHAHWHIIYTWGVCRSLLLISPWSNTLSPADIIHTAAQVQTW